MSLNLETFHYLIAGNLNSNTSDQNFNYNTSTFDTADYDGSPSYTLELIYTNTDTTDKTITLMNGANTVDTITATASVSSPTLITKNLSLSGAYTFNFKLEATTSTNQLKISYGRIRITQTSATKTKIHIPMLGGSYNMGSAQYSPFAANVISIHDTSGAWEAYDAGESGTTNVFIWERDDSWLANYKSSNPFKLEVACNLASSGDDELNVALYNRTDSQIVTASTVTVTGSNRKLASTSFNEDETYFETGKQYEVRFKAVSPIQSIEIYEIYLSIYLDTVSAVTNYYRLLGGRVNMLSDYLPIDNNRIAINQSSFTNYEHATLQIRGFFTSATASEFLAFTDGTNASGTSSTVAVVNSEVASLSASPSQLYESSNITLQSSGYYYLLGYDENGTENARLYTGYIVLRAGTEWVSPEVNDVRAGILTGKDTDNETRAAITTGQSTANDTRSAATDGIASSNSARSGALLGKDTSQSSRASMTTGSLSNDSSRAALLDGAQGSNTSRSGSMWGTDTALDERPARVSANTPDSSERASVIEGINGSTSTRQATLKGHVTTWYSKTSSTWSKNY